jgi:NhaA family Na+:H+ antiporter
MRHQGPNKTPLMTLVSPFQKFAAMEASGGILLFASTVVALIWANSYWRHEYTALWHAHFNVGLGRLNLNRDLHFWVNDALMSVFFFLVGLEIKRELLVGELSSLRQAALPILAALGGVLVPAAFYTALNSSGSGARGWAIPMATDIAFALGVMALLGDRVPLGLKVFLTALAIVDDIAAVLVIALFYTAHLAWGALGVAACCLLLAIVANRFGVRHPLPYALIGAALWMAVLLSGVHATIAGVLLAFTIPSRTSVNQDNFLGHSRALPDHVETVSPAGTVNILSDIEQQTAVDALEDPCEEVQSPLHRFETALHPWVAFLILPLFALANAGVSLPGDVGKLVTQPITLGVVFGLILGKPIGVTIASWLAVRTGLAALPENVSWMQIQGAGWLAGIGLTMSFFLTSRSFTVETQLTAAKFGILIASLCASVVGSALLMSVVIHKEESSCGAV